MYLNKYIVEFVTLAARYDSVLPQILGLMTIRCNNEVSSPVVKDNKNIKNNTILKQTEQFSSSSHKAQKSKSRRQTL